MAQDIIIAGNAWNAVPYVDFNKAGGGDARFTDISDSTITAETVLNGFVGYDANGNKVTGTAGGLASGSITPTDRSFSVTVDTGLDDIKFLLIFTDLTALQKTGAKYNCLIFSDFTLQRTSMAAQNNSGTDWLWYNNAFTANNCKVTRNGSTVTISNTSQSVTGNTLGYFQAKKYNWIAWG